MGRPREFDTTEALERALDVFWANGYEATSMRDLTGAMGLSKSSLYDTFGSKHELFLSALDHYNKTSGQRSVLALIEKADTVKAGIAAAFLHYIDQMTADEDRRGVLYQQLRRRVGAPRPGGGCPVPGRHRQHGRGVLSRRPPGPGRWRDPGGPGRHGLGALPDRKPQRPARSRQGRPRSRIAGGCCPHYPVRPRLDFFRYSGPIGLEKSDTHLT